MTMLQNQLRDGSEISGISTGLTELDKITLGFQNTDLLILAARPGMGKTSLALSIAAHVAVNEGKCAAIFSLEMGAEQLAMRLMAMEAHINLKDLRGGRPKESEFRRVADAMARLSEAPLYIDDTPAISLTELRARARRLKLQGRCDMLIIDYLQLMSAPARISSREQQISEISRGLKALAKELKIPVVALSQLNRSLESRPNKRPMLSDLRESGAIEQDADVIMFVYRDEYYHPDSEDKGVSEIIVGKQRNGPTGVAKVSFIAQYTKFANLVRYQTPFSGDVQ
jgi:replicative DNA helicase